MSSPETVRPADVSVDREKLCSLLAEADEARVIHLADACIADAQDELQLIRPPQTGSIVWQIREPIARERFILADVLVSHAEVIHRGIRGWGMRQGESHAAVLAQAVCEAEVVSGGKHAADVIALCKGTEHDRAQAREKEWQELTPTIVEFEEIP